MLSAYKISKYIPFFLSSFSGPSSGIRRTTSQWALIAWQPRREARTPQLGVGRVQKWGRPDIRAPGERGFNPQDPHAIWPFYLWLPVSPPKPREGQWLCGWELPLPLPPPLVPREQDLVSFSIRGPQCTTGEAQ